MVRVCTIIILAIFLAMIAICGASAEQVGTVDTVRDAIGLPNGTQ